VALRHHRRAAESDEPGPPEIQSPDLHQPALGLRVLVIGGTGVVGSAVVAALATAGARVAVHHEGKTDPGSPLLAGLPGTGHMSIRADISDAESAAALIGAVDAEFDGLDVVINAAAARRDTGDLTIKDSSLTQWTDAWTTNLTVDVLGTAIVIHAAAQAFMARNRPGKIILLAARGKVRQPGSGSMADATERAVAALGSALAIELAPQAVSVLVIGSTAAAAPGWSPQLLAETVLWLCYGPAATLDGAVVHIAG